MLVDDRVRSSYLSTESHLPVVLEPQRETDLAAWAEDNGAMLEGMLAESGAVLFRNFALAGPRDFERAAAAVCGELYGEYGDLPKHGAGERIYHSTPYPADQMILWHNESSHLSSWPMRTIRHSWFRRKRVGWRM